MQCGTDGLWRGVGFSLGAVVLVQDAGRVLLVRKAAKAGYDFSGMWAMPGGRIRGEGTLAEAIDRTMRLRFSAEAGLSLSGGLVPLPVSPPPLSRYTVAGTVRNTLVLPLLGHAAGEPVTDDASISEAIWADPMGMWRRIAPANRIILGAALWVEMDGLQRASARSALREAWEECAMWGAMLRLPPPPEPWRQR